MRNVAATQYNIDAIACSSDMHDGIDHGMDEIGRTQHSSERNTAPNATRLRSHNINDRAADNHDLQSNGFVQRQMISEVWHGTPGRRFLTIVCGRANHAAQDSCDEKVERRDGTTRAHAQQTHLRGRTGGRLGGGLGLTIPSIGPGTFLPVN